MSQYLQAFLIFIAFAAVVILGEVIGYEKVFSLALLAPLILAAIIAVIPGEK